MLARIRHKSSKLKADLYSVDITPNTVCSCGAPIETLNTILTHTSNAKCFRSVILMNIRGLAEIIVSVRGYGRHSPKQAMIKRE